MSFLRLLSPREWFRAFVAWGRNSRHTYLMLLAVAVGALAGIGDVVFLWLLKSIQSLSWGGAWSMEWISSRPAWLILLVPTAGGVLVGLLVFYGAREAKGHGVPEVMEAVVVRSGVIRPRVVVVKFIASAITIGTGGSVGREGPIVQIGAALGSTIGQWFRLDGARLKTLVGCGAAAGIAATFNAPLAGALFAAEIVLLGEFGVGQFSPIVISSVLATVISRNVLGNEPAFVVPQHELVSFWELGFYAFLGLASGVVAHLFVKVLYWSEDFFDGIRIRQQWILPSVGGLMLGTLGIFAPQVLGGGYETITNALSGNLPLTLLLALVGLKLIATSITLGSGASGGIFAPSLYLGAMTGGLVGEFAHFLFPSLVAGSGAYALVGMGAVVAAGTRAPLTAILIIFELTSDYKLILPLMGSCIIATLVASRLNRESIYTLKLVQRGIELFQGHEKSVLRSMHVSEVMHHDPATVRFDEPLGHVIQEVTQNPRGIYYVVDDDLCLRGVIMLADLRRSLPSVNALSDLIVAEDLIHEELPCLTPQQDLDVAMKLFGGKDWEELPVVQSKESRKLLGGLSRQALMGAYNQELTRRDMTAGMFSGIAATEAGDVALGGDYLLSELAVPPALVGRSLRELDVRTRFGVQVLLVRRVSEQGKRREIVAGPDTVLEAGDRLVLLGREEALKPLRHLQVDGDA